MITKNLKDSTKVLHAETERALNAKRMFAPNFNAPEYIEILKTLFHAHQQVENELDRIDDPQFQALFHKHYAPRLELITKDLLAMGGEIPGPLPDLIEIDNHFQAFGALYVLKGSTLGGKFIYQQLEKTTLDWPKISLLFYGYERENVMENWKAYSDDFNSLSFSQEEKEEIINGAQKTFNTFIEACSLMAR
jgi:heme oxygenase (biliverdin-IX-beta and delta-forming)